MKYDCSQSFFQLADRDWGRSWVPWPTGWPQDCRQKRMFYLNTFHPLALLNTTEIVFSALNWGPPQPTSNISLLVDMKTAHQNRPSVVPYFIDSRKKAILIFLRGIFSNNQVINSFSQIAYSILWTWIPNKVFGFMWHRQVMGSNNCYGEKWKKNENINMCSLDRLVVG